MSSLPIYELEQIRFFALRLFSVVSKTNHKYIIRPLGNLPRPLNLSHWRWHSCTSVAFPFSNVKAYVTTNCRLIWENEKGDNVYLSYKVRWILSISATRNPIKSKHFQFPTRAQWYHSWTSTITSLHWRLFCEGGIRCLWIRIFTARLAEKGKSQYLR